MGPCILPFFLVVWFMLFYSSLYETIFYMEIYDSKALFEEQVVSMCYSNEIKEFLFLITIATTIP